jgi:hypothetical protein
VKGRLRETSRRYTVQVVKLTSAMRPTTSVWTESGWNSYVPLRELKESGQFPKRLRPHKTIRKSVFVIVLGRDVLAGLPSFRPSICEKVGVVKDLFG